MSEHRPEISVVVPAHDEEGNVLLLARAIADALQGHDHEILLVDDESQDGTRAEMLAAAAENRRVRVLRRRGRRGKSAALLAGFQNARGEIVATIDADLQDDPRDILTCLAALEPGIDAVNGWRRRRDDSLVKRVSSKIGNGVRRRVLGGRIRDAGTGIRVFRRRCLPDILPFEGMHRYFAELVAMHGHAITEVPVGHRRRHAGRAKYGVGNRALRGLADVLAVLWMQRRLIRAEIRELDAGGAEPDAATARGSEELDAREETARRGSAP